MTRLATIWIDAQGEADLPFELEYTKVLHDAAFIGDLLGAELAAARAVLRDVRDGRALAPAEARILADAYRDVRACLAAAIDDHGHARAGRADALLASDVIASDPDGTLYLRGGRVDLLDLLHTLAHLDHLFAAARDRGLAVHIAYE